MQLTVAAIFGYITCSKRLVSKDSDRGKPWVTLEDMNRFTGLEYVSETRHFEDARAGLVESFTWVS